MHEVSDLIEFAIVMVIVSIPILAFTVGRPLARAWGARLSAGNTLQHDELAALEHRLDARLSRLESYVQSMSVEVERIGEANRYLLNAADANAGAQGVARVAPGTPVVPR